MLHLPLRGIRTLDFSWAAAGPAGQTLCALMGAEVIKVESRTRVDFNRRSSAGTVIPPGEVDMSPRFTLMNLNKLGVQLNLQHPEGVGLARELVRISTVVVENYRSGTMDRLGLGYQALGAVKPDIIMLSVSMAGGSGPDGGLPGYAPVFNALGGLGYLTGYEDGPPTELRLSVDLRVALTGTFALLAALYHWRETGEGQHIDLSATEAVTSLIGDQLLDYTMNGRSPTRRGNRDDAMAPHDCYPCLVDDSWVSIAVASDEEWQRLCSALGKPELARDERFADQLSRWDNQDLLRPIIESWTREHTHYEVMETLQRVGVAAIPSFSFEEVVNNPHVLARGTNVTVMHPRQGRVVAPGVPWKLSGLPSIPARSAPLMGEHNQYVYGELLGLSPARIADLIERRVIY